MGPVSGGGILIETKKIEEQSRITIMASEGTRVVGGVMLVAPVHVEGIWIDPAYQCGLIMKQLVDRVEEEARNLKISKVFAYAINGEMEDYIERLGYKKLPWTVWEKEL